MSSIAYNLTRKLEWMGRRLRHIDDAGEIKNWVSAMNDINCLLKEVDIKECSDGWRPYRKRDYGLKKDIGDSVLDTAANTWSLKRIKKMESIPTLGLKDRLLKEIKKKEEWKLPTQKVIPPRVQVNFEEIHQLNQLVKEIDVTLQPHEKRKRKKLTKEREAERGDVKDDGQRIPAEIRSFIENEGITHLDP